MWSSRLELRLQGHQRKNACDVLTEGGQSRKVVGMRSVAIIFCAALLVGLPTISHAQYNDSDQQDPKEYHDEDSQPLSLAADLLYPIGFGIEWLVSRPMHWFTTDSPAAPVYRPVGGRDMSPPPPGSDHPRQHDGPDDSVHYPARLVADAQASHGQCNRDPAVRTVAGFEQPAGASLNFRVPQGSVIRGLSSPLNVAYL